MHVRRVVTGHDADGKAVFVGDDLVEPVTTALLPGNAFHRLWGSDTTRTFPDDGSQPDAARYFPPLDGSRFAFFTIPPDGGAGAPADIDIGAALTELEEKLPGMAEHFELDNPGMHTTASIDYGVVISGQVTLELDDGATVSLSPGDTYVQNGTRHRWSNPNTVPAVIAVVLIGAHRDALTRAVAHEYDPFAWEHLDDPYPFYARLRADPSDLIDVPDRGVLVAARHDVARAVLRDHTTYRSGLGVQWVPVAEAGIRATFIENDPPEHTRVRRAVQQWATPRAIDEIATVVAAIVEELVDHLVEAGGGDVMGVLARRVPLRVMSEWLGLVLPDAATSWADASFRLGAPDPPASTEEQFAGFLAWALGDGFASLRPGGLAERILAGGDQQRLREDEPFVALASIIIAGLDTTVHLIGNGIAALAENPDQLAALVDDPTGRGGNAVEEILRYDAPVRFFLRRTDHGRTVVVLYGSANRDERVFDEPDRFLIDRDASAHLAFGTGIHLCLGAPLARLEGAAVFRTLAERVSAIEILPGAQRTTSAAIRGFATLPVRLVAR